MFDLILKSDKLSLVGVESFIYWLKKPITLKFLLINSYKSFEFLLNI